MSRWCRRQHRIDVEFVGESVVEVNVDVGIDVDEHIQCNLEAGPDCRDAVQVELVVDVVDVVSDAHTWLSRSTGVERVEPVDAVLMKLMMVERDVDVVDDVGVDDPCEDFDDVARMVKRVILVHAVRPAP
eukprot:3855733-Amphidinium_carterae.1